MIFLIISTVWGFGKGLVHIKGLASHLPWFLQNSFSPWLWHLMGINIVAHQWRMAKVPDLLTGPLEQLSPRHRSAWEVEDSWMSLKQGAKVEWLPSLRCVAVDSSCISGCSMGRNSVRFQKSFMHVLIVSCTVHIAAGMSFLRLSFVKCEAKG